MRKKKMVSLKYATEAIEEGFFDIDDIRLIEDNLEYCLTIGGNAARIADVIDSESIIKHYDSLVKHGARIIPEAVLYGMPNDATWRHIDWFINHGVQPDVLVRYFKDGIYNPAYKPIDLMTRLLKIGASKYLVFEAYSPHLKSLINAPEELIHDLGVLMENGIDRHRIMFWVDKHMEASDIIKYSKQLEKFGVDAGFYEKKILEEYGVNTDSCEDGDCKKYSVDE